MCRYQANFHHQKTDLQLKKKKSIKTYKQPAFFFNYFGLFKNKANRLKLKNCGLFSQYKFEKQKKIWGLSITDRRLNYVSNEPHILICIIYYTVGEQKEVKETSWPGFAIHCSTTYLTGQIPKILNKNKKNKKFSLKK